MTCASQMPRNKENTDATCWLESGLTQQLHGKKLPADCALISNAGLPNITVFLDVYGCLAGDNLFCCLLLCLCVMQLHLPGKMRAISVHNDRSKATHCASNYLSRGYWFCGTKKGNVLWHGRRGVILQLISLIGFAVRCHGMNTISILNVRLDYVLKLLSADF